MVLRVFVPAEANLVPNYILALKARVPNINGMQRLDQRRQGALCANYREKDPFQADGGKAQAILSKKCMPEL